MSTSAHANDSRVAVLVDCENTQPDILDYALRVVAQFGRIVLRRGYGNHPHLVGLAFTPCATSATSLPNGPSGLSPSQYGPSELLHMMQTCDLLTLRKKDWGHYMVMAG